ncbi:MAG: hypothetical protein PHR36_02875 [Patescibacteria group bacterium]|nr:hypothetical protein [Patescibacteria group bacterium]
MYDDYPDITVENLTDEEVRELVSKHNPRGVNLGYADGEREADKLISQLRDKGGRRFLLRWTANNKVPKGAKVFGYQITWTQHGKVYGKVRTAICNIGTYDRLVEFGGESGEEQMMIVYLYPEFS